MKIEVFAVFDGKARCYGQPFFFQNEQVAVRAWRETVNDATTTFYKHPQDFSLFKLGSYDDLSGSFESLTEPQNLGLAAQYKELVRE